MNLRQQYESGNQVNADPLVVVFEDFLTDDEIAELLAAARPKLQQALVSDVSAGVKSSGRTGSNCWIPHAYSDVIANLSMRVSELVGVPLDCAESLQVVHYGEQQEYAPHYDAWEAGTERGDRCMARGGQRLVTCLMYLNEPERGGGTSFPRLDMEVRARRGRMVLFHNCEPGSTVRHNDSLHGGMPVEQGEKWACNFWFRETTYQTTGSVPGQSKNSNQVRKYKRVI